MAKLTTYDIKYLEEGIEQGKYLSSNVDSIPQMEKMNKNEISDDQWASLQIQFAQLKLQLETDKARSTRNEKQEQYIQSLLYENQSMQRQIAEFEHQQNSLFSKLKESEMLLGKMRDEKCEIEKKLKSAQEEIDQKIEKMTKSKEKEYRVQINALSEELQKVKDNAGISWDTLIEVVTNEKDSNKRDVGFIILSSVLSNCDVDSDTYMEISKRIAAARDGKPKSIGDLLSERPINIEFNVDNSDKSHQTIEQLNMGNGFQTKELPK